MTIYLTLGIIFAIYDDMKITKQATDEYILRELGGRISDARLQRNITQAQMAEQAGVSKRTVERLESGSVATQLSSFLRICRALDMVERLDIFLPESSPNPMQQLKLRGQKRKRASKDGALKASAKAWRWGDEK
jgi:transcriptional regulator with XRE-family HTH domain